MVCPAPNCSCSFVGAKLVKHLLTCRNLSSLQCEICEVLFTNPMSKCRHKKAGLCKPPPFPSPIWSPNARESTLATTALLNVQEQAPVQEQVQLRYRYDNGVVVKLEAQDGTYLTDMRIEDGYINASDMCKQTETTRSILRLKDYLRRPATSKTAAAKANVLNIPEQDMIKNIEDNVMQTSTWLHPAMAPDFTSWCDLRFDNEAVDQVSTFISPKVVTTTPLIYFVQGILDLNGRVLAEFRVHDGYVNIESISKYSWMFIQREDGFDAWKKGRTGALINMAKKYKSVNPSPSTLQTYTRPEMSVDLVVGGKQRGTWVHPKAGIQYMEWCGLKIEFENNSNFMKWIGNASDLGITAPPAIIVSTPESDFLESLRGDDGQLITELRTSDGFINATKMCSSATTSGGHCKMFKNWLCTNTAFLHELKKELYQSGEICSGQHLNADQNDDDNFTCLVEVTRGGKYTGTWVHPRVAIEVARWCSVKFNVQTNSLIHRYTKGEVTTQESQAVATTIKKSFDTHLDISSHPLPITYPDVFRPSVEDRTLGIPTAALPPNAAYVIRIGGLADGHTVDKYGRTANFAVRMSTHERDHSGCQILMIITTGTHDSKPIEDTLKSFFAGQKIEVEKPNGKALTECFKSMSDIEYIDRARLLLIRTHANIIQTIHFNNKFYDYKNVNNLEIEQEKTLQAIELTKQDEAKALQEQAKADQEGAKVQQLTLRLELAKLGITS